MLRKFTFLRSGCRAWAAGAAALGCLLPMLVHAHGAKLESRMVQGVALRAMYDTGDPMTTAQITVYAPDNPSKPWLTGKADPQGHFRFVPDPSIPGQWTIQAREAGHGALIYITVGGDNSPADKMAGATSNASGAQAMSAAPVTTSAYAHSPLQRWVMTACVVWGFIGTGLFFARNRMR